MNILNNNGRPSCPKMIKANLPMKSASSNARFRRKPTFIPLVPLPLDPKDQKHEHHHHHHEHMQYLYFILSLFYRNFFKNPIKIVADTKDHAM